MYECPNCGSNVKYHIGSQMMKCDSCDSTFDPYSFEKQSTQAEEAEYFDTTVFTCPQCGGELIGDVNEAAVFCTYCGASNVLESKMTKTKRPKYIIPFSKSKEDCKNAYSKFMGRAIFAPKELKKAEYIDGFRGIYMPYWSYDIEQKGNVNLHGKKEYRKGDYIYTDHYTTSGNINAEYSGYSKDASSSFDDRLSESIAPFYSQEQKAFTPAFISGFYADVADVESDVYEMEAKDFSCRESVNAIRQSPKVKAALIDEPDSPNVLHTHVKEVVNCMHPVWFLSYRNNDRVAYATVNGQTGKVAADVPIDIRKFVLGAIMLTLPLFFLYNLLFAFRPLTLLEIAFGMMIITYLIYMGSNSLIRKRQTGESDRGAQSVMKEKKEISEDQFRAKWFYPIPYLILCGGISVLLYFVRPVSDIPYYAGVLLNTLYMLMVLIVTIINYNRFATRPLPQFDRKGGDDRA